MDLLWTYVTNDIDKQEILCEFNGYDLYCCINRMKPSKHSTDVRVLKMLFTHVSSLIDFSFTIKSLYRVANSS